MISRRLLLNFSPLLPYYKKRLGKGVGLFLLSGKVPALDTMAME